MKEFEPLTKGETGNEYKSQNVGIFYEKNVTNTNYDTNGSHDHNPRRKTDSQRLVAVIGIFFVIGFWFTLWYYLRDNDTCGNSVFMQSSIYNTENIIDPDTDPCDDFYTFACGRWNLTVLKEYNYSSVIKEVEIRNLLRLESYLKCSSHTNLNDWSRFIKKAFDLCEKGKYSSSSKSKTVAFVKRLAGPLLERKHHFVNFEDTLRNVHHRVLQNGLFFWDVVLGRQSVSDEIIQAIRVGPPKNHWTSELSSGVKNHLTAYITDVLVLLGADEQFISPISNEIVEFIILLNTQLSKAKYFFKVHQRSLPKKETTYRKFCEEFNFINFSSYFEVLITDSTPVIIQEIDYFFWLKSYIEKSKMENNRAIHYFLIWSAVDFFVPFMTKEFSQVLDKYSTLIHPKKKDVLERNHVCVKAIKNGMNFAASSFFMDEILKEESRLMVNEIFLHVKNLFRDFLHSLQYSHPCEKKTNWLDGLKEVFEKVEIGVPGNLRKIYEKNLSYGHVDNSFPSHYLFALNCVRTYMLNQTRNVPTGVLFLLDLLQPNGLFINLPFLVINVGILTPPLFDFDQPISFNYAGFGFVLAHELAHSIDFLATNTTSIRNVLNSTLMCLHEQYDDLRRVWNVDQEDFADNIAIKIAFEAYTEHMNQRGIPSRNISLRDRKMFFLQYSQIWCEDGSSFNINHNTFHSPYKHRINKPLSNFPAFSEAFSCRIGSAMNAENKCLMLQEK